MVNLDYVAALAIAVIKCLGEHSSRAKPQQVSSWLDWRRYNSSKFTQCKILGLCPISREVYCWYLPIKIQYGARGNLTEPGGGMGPALGFRFRDLKILKGKELP